MIPQINYDEKRPKKDQKMTPQIIQKITQKMTPKMIEICPPKNFGALKLTSLRL